MKRLFTENALQQLRSEIAACGGNEVFFLGKTDAARIVVAVEPLARGSRDTVAAIMITASFGDVVIHNHPSGNLTPSTADLEIAATMGNQGIGFYIIDNLAEQAYQAVSPFIRKKINYISLAEIDAFFQPDGLLSANLAGYEHRSEQTRMSMAVAEAFNGDRVAVIEAGTGTGKSLAYLLPAALWAKSNRERVVISTNTINLQEQLTGKDIPFLQKYGKVSFRAALIKGRGNYLCLRKLTARREEPGLFHDEKSELQAIAAWSETTASGCRDDLGFIPRDEVWEELCSEGDQCGRTKCKSYGRCHFYSSRRNAAAADILVVNHALLMADLSLREQAGATSAAILPPFQRLIIDEAHHLEDVATGNLSSQITRSGLLKLLGKLQHPRRAERGLLPKLSGAVNAAIPEGFDTLYRQIAALLDDELLAVLPQLADTIGREMDGIGYALSGHLRPAEGRLGEQKLRLTPAVYGSDFWGESLERINRLAGKLLEFNNALGRILKAVSGLPEKPLESIAGVITDMKGVKGRIDGALLALLHFVGHEETVCRWFEMKKGGKGLVVRLCSSPLDVAPTLKRVLFDQLRTVIMTSATLAVGERFDYLEQRTGVSLLPTVRRSELLLASPFDYDRQVFVGVPADMPEPTDRRFEAAAADFILETQKISHGRAFVLFTSYDLLKRVHTRLAPQLEAMGLVPLRQGETNRQLLLARFKATAGAVLFGTDSFWEGVDVQGEALELVIITRLPFRVPTEPILEARSEYISASGGDPFREYTVPQAVIKFKQGFGRLIRSRNDRGAVLILDSRVLSKNYGRIFLQSLPEVKVTATGSEELLTELRQFY
ncbi:MAG: helicase c2 [Deltaproteobacteria bacterium]|nr:helicase c2 [Deltaproteobacteria bacterium]